MCRSIDVSWRWLVSFSPSASLLKMHYQSLPGWLFIHVYIFINPLMVKPGGMFYYRFTRTTLTCEKLLCSLQTSPQHSINLRNLLGHQFQWNPPTMSDSSTQTLQAANQLNSSNWVWVKIRYPNNWMVNTKLDIHICGPLNGLPFWPTSIYYGTIPSGELT